MEMKVYCFFDRVSQSFLPQFFCINNDDVAKRSFRTYANSSQFPFKDIKEDLQIFSIGTFSNENGLLNCDKNFVCNVADFVEKEK